MAITRSFASLAISLLGLGCNAQLATVLASADAGPAGSDAATTTTDGGTGVDAATTTDGATPEASTSTTGDCVTRGGVCVPAGQSAPPTHRLAGANEGTCGTSGAACWVRVATTPTRICTTHQDCNESASVSALWGSCFEGFCMCKQGFHVQPSGKCGPKPAPDCSTQGGTCAQMPATCPTGKLESTLEVNMTCGDLIAAVCCLAEAACAGPADFSCCAPNDGIYEPVCINGFRTCESSNTPVKKPGSCGG